MNLTTLHLPPETAAAKLAAIRKSLHGRADKKYANLAKVYKAACDGLPILDLARTMRSCDTFKTHMPRLAVARADRSRVVCHRYNNSVEFNTSDNVWASQPGSLDIRIRRMPTISYDGGRPQGETPVPGIPPEVRERNTGRDRQRFILWEVESWDMVPDRDPLLLKHLAGNYYAIVDHWDLTELEAAILSGSQ